MKTSHGKKHHKREADRRPQHARQATESPSSTIYGVIPVLEALKSEGRSVERIFVLDGVREHRLSELMDAARKNRVIVDRLAREAFEKRIGPDANHQGVVAIVSAAEYADADELLDSAGPESLFLILDGVEDPRNFGAILRCAEAAGVSGVFIPERRAVGITDTVAKASAGASEHIKVAKVPNLNRLIEELKERDVWVVGTAAEGEKSYTDWDWNGPTALVLGSEGSGLHRLVAENCDVLVRIPMYGKIGSLNVSVAAGVVLFEARRQRGSVT